MVIRGQVLDCYNYMETLDRNWSGKCRRSFEGRSPTVTIIWNHSVEIGRENVADDSGAGRRLLRLYGNTQ